MRKSLLSLLLLMALAPAGLAPASARQPGGCGDPATPIHAIQGSTDRTPEAGNRHTIEGVVVADLQNRQTQFGGFFVQADDPDDDPTTSEGIFVDGALSQIEVQVGDRVRVTGTAFEFTSDAVTLTQLRRVQSVEVCASGAAIEPTAVTLPVQSQASWEQWEGMLITFPQTLTVTEVYNLGRYGELMLAAEGRLFQPTNVAAPGAPALAVQTANDLRQFILDDGLNIQNPDPAPYGLDGQHSVRAGDTLTGVTGVLDQRFGVYRVQPYEPPQITPANPRPAAPPEVGGQLRAASLNVLNYFNGPDFPTARGATTPDEFDRQRAKTIAAILSLDADIVALMEMENDGSGPDSAVADLVNGLNEAAGREEYAYIPDPAGLEAPGAVEGEGGDAIKQTLIYRPAVVRPVGDPVLTLDAPYGSRRPPVAQAFEEIATGERLIVVANHFKSKSCTDVTAGPDADQGDGQSCWNAERVQAAQTLLAWLATDPTGTGDPDVLLLGDFNAYAREDPLAVLAEGGFARLLPDDDYSYIYFGMAGSLDHALASASLAPRVTGAATWHINADEPRVLDYNIEFKSSGQVESFYDPGPFRAADHDPLVVGLALSSTTPLPPDAGSEESGTDATGGLVAVIAGLIAVLFAMIAGIIGLRRRGG